MGFREARWSHPNQDKHKAPSSTLPRPLSLQDAGRTFLDSIVTHHQDAGDASVPMVQLPDSLVKHSSGVPGYLLKTHLAAEQFGFSGLKLVFRERSRLFELRQLL